MAAEENERELLDQVCTRLGKLDERLKALTNVTELRCTLLQKQVTANQRAIFGNGNRGLRAQVGFLMGAWGIMSVLLVGVIAALVGVIFRTPTPVP